jgi:hypothetical protein
MHRPAEIADCGHRTFRSLCTEFTISIASCAVETPMA